MLAGEEPQPAATLWCVNRGNTTTGTSGTRFTSHLGASREPMRVNKRRRRVYIHEVLRG